MEIACPKCGRTKTYSENEKLTTITCVFCKHTADYPFLWRLENMKIRLKNDSRTDSYSKELNFKKGVEILKSEFSIETCKKAEEFFRISMNAGNRLSEYWMMQMSTRCINIANRYQDIKSEDYDFERAKDAFLHAEKLGFTEAREWYGILLNNHAMRFHMGITIEPNLEQAIHFYELSIDVKRNQYSKTVTKMNLEKCVYEYATVICNLEDIELPTEVLMTSLSTNGKYSRYVTSKGWVKIVSKLIDKSSLENQNLFPMCEKYFSRIQFLKYEVNQELKTKLAVKYVFVAKQLISLAQASDEKTILIYLENAVKYGNSVAENVLKKWLLDTALLKVEQKSYVEAEFYFDKIVLIRYQEEKRSYSTLCLALAEYYSHKKLYDLDFEKTIKFYSCAFETGNRDVEDTLFSALFARIENLTTKENFSFENARALLKQTHKYINREMKDEVQNLIRKHDVTLRSIYEKLLFIAQQENRRLKSKEPLMQMYKEISTLFPLELTNLDTYLERHFTVQINFKIIEMKALLNMYYNYSTNIGKFKEEFNKLTGVENELGVIFLLHLKKKGCTEENIFNYFKGIDEKEWNTLYKEDQPLLYKH
jgi:hypothetical protein